MAKLKNLTLTVNSSIIVNHIFQKENQAGRGGTTVTSSHTASTDRKRANYGKRVFMLQQ